MKTPDFILGIDPGLGGALALYDTRSGQCSPEHGTWLMPLNRKRTLDVEALCLSIHTVCAERDVVAVIENVHSRPRQAGAFNFGLSTGIIHGILAANDIPMVLMAPSEWKVKMGLQRDPLESQDSTKDRARALAAKLFPNLADQFKRKKDDGRAEALLIAFYYHHKMTGGVK